MATAIQINDTKYFKLMVALEDIPTFGEYHDTYTIRDKQQPNTKSHISVIVPSYSID